MSNDGDGGQKMGQTVARVVVGEKAPSVSHLSDRGVVFGVNGERVVELAEGGGVSGGWC
jgi:hypothetical protein